MFIAGINKLATMRFNMNKKIFISLLLLCHILVAQTNQKYKPTKDFSLDSVKINGYSWIDSGNYKFFKKYKAGVQAADCINDTTFSNWYSFEDFKKTKDTAKVYFSAQELTIPENLFNMPIFRVISADVEKIWQNGKLVYDFTINDNTLFFHRIAGIDYPFSFSKEKNIIIQQVKSEKQRQKADFGATFKSHFSYLHIIQTKHDSNVTSGTLSSFLFAVSLMLIFIYLFGIREKKYLWGTGFTFSLALGLFLYTGFLLQNNIEVIAATFLFVSPYFLVQFVYSLFNFPLPKLVKKILLILSLLLVCFVIMLLSEAQFFSNYFEKVDKNVLSLIIPLILFLGISSVYVFIGVFKAVKQKLNNAWVLFFGLLLFVALSVYWLYESTNGGWDLSDTNWFKVLQILPMPLAVLIAIVRDYVASNKSLKMQLIKVEELTAQTIREQEEKQQILALQNEKLEQQVTERTKEINGQKHLLEEKNKEITDSINYAQRLQQAILPSIEFITQNFPNNFVLYKPKDIVAGDFYWAEKIGEKFFIAAADSTGHGVPGAIVSVVCSNALNRTIKEFKLTETGKILDKTRELVIETFEKSASEVKDGMDISLLCIDSKNKNIYWSGANNPLWYIQDNELKEIKADKQPIGKTEYPKPFRTHEIEYKANTTFYLFTDGFADQFGGPNGKKFKYKQFSDLLVKNNNLSQSQQAEIINKAFSDWKGDLEQVDDVCVIGIKI
jgi:serine phosphatase RsbU (regulator of sigma subunit)